MRTALYRSPTFGGGSWLAHGSMASGVQLDDQRRYDRLMRTDLRPLSGYFARAGRRTLAVMPRITKPWPTGDWFGFDRTLVAGDFDYRGPAFGWANMPDQYVLDAVARSALAPPRGPIFAEFVLVSSHAPFHVQPTFVADWDIIGDGSIFHTHPKKTFPITWPDLSGAGEAYATSIAYDLRTIAAWLERSAGADALAIVSGDHQPARDLTGPDAPFDVPAHVISRRTDLVEAFAARGYGPGFRPRLESDAPPMSTFFFDLLATLSRAASRSDDHYAH